MTDPIVTAAMFLAGHVEWIRHRREAAEFLDDVEACARIVRNLARGPAERRYLGPCGARITSQSDENGVLVSEECPGDIYAYRGAHSGRCDNCGADVNVAERQQWIDDLAREHAFTDTYIAEAYPELKIKTIRTWRDRGKLKTYWRNDAGLTVPWEEPPDGEKREKLHYVGDVLDLAAADAARRAENEARRARRTQPTEGATP